ncbi:MAG: esterase family protein [Ardenticatenaceae bacterium]|nr:esterase family protein [Anaerolineales bacterium]MCB8940328.1 esterase family protein [Ardenticatenaceae bacterium]MCB8973344.1 esterase family protein [Ardenticatenaceae bacterium]
MIDFVFWLTAVLTLTLILIITEAKRRRAELRTTVEVVTLPDFASQALGNSREITVFLPPGYAQDTNRRYPTLYVNDGQDQEALQIRETLAKLCQRRQLPPIILVAVPTNHDRLQEYGTAVCPNAQNLGTKAGEYGRFLTTELIPAINQQFRTSQNPTHIGIFGVSLAGLSAFDIAWNWPDLFGVVGVMSGSFWWRAAEDETKMPPNQLIAQAMVRQTPTKPNFRLWFEAATQDEASDRDGNGVIDAIQDTLELIAELKVLGFSEDEVVYVEVPGGRHNYETWAQVFPHFLRWAFG